MRLFLKTLAGIIILTSFQSCKKIIEIDLPVTESKVVVNSFFTDNKQIKVQISKSISVLDNAIPECDDATIILFKDKVITDTLFLSGGYYYSHVKAERGKEYSLITSVPDMDTVSCKDIIPEKTIIQSYNLTDSVMIDEDGLVITELNIGFLDPPDSNYYEVALTAECVYNFQTIKLALWFEKNSDPVITSTGLLDYNPKTLIFTDKMFDGKSCSLKVYYAMQAEGIPKIGNGPAYGYKLNVSLRSISESYYKYKEKQFAYLFSLENDIFSGMSEPIGLYSNITNGYGIFAGYSSDEKAINVIVR